MSRAPHNPDQPDASDIKVTDRPGKRYLSRHSELWEIEQEMAAEGQLPEDANRAIPVSEHPERIGDVTADELRERIKRESETPVPNKSRIGHLNDLLAEVSSDE